ncbi:WW domain-binding protein 2-like isoform X1 [Scyliorhinus canicula]|uniref:WW domain-binding protein 2-like isoform X1 n=1 Tax=Scyliorhinus canicula TaxID=7830 RepID=UPI0018F42C0A|nr:WW domain-binding protein 2-like isoform X1 [Scyliorhinus canicula]
MALNTVGSQNGMPILQNPERVLLSFNNVQLTFKDIKPTPDALKGKKIGMVFLTPHRVLFIPKDQSKAMKSFSMPFGLMEGCSIEQGILVANYIKGKIHAQPAGGWEGTATFKLAFFSGGAIDFGKAMINVATHALRSGSAYNPVVYVYQSGSFMPARRNNYYRSADPVVYQGQQQQFAYVPGQPPPAGGYYAPVPPTYAPHGPPPASQFSSMQPPSNVPQAGTSAGYYPSAPSVFANYSSPLNSPDQPIPSTAGTLSDFNPAIISMPNYYSAPLSSDHTSQSHAANKSTKK